MHDTAGLLRIWQDRKIHKTIQIQSIIRSKTCLSDQPLHLVNLQ